MGLASKCFACFAVVTLVAGCATSPKKFYEDPAAAKTTPLCRAYFESTDPKFRQDVAAELRGRGMTEAECQNKINTENTVLAVSAIAIGAVGVAAACSNRNCGGGGGYSAPRSYNVYSATDYDCYGGSGNGPYYVQGPFSIGSYDPHGLDADNDGIACEASDIGYGS